LTGSPRIIYRAGLIPPISFKEFLEEWIIDQYLRTLDEFALRNPGIWDIFQDELISKPSHDLCHRLYLSRDSLVDFAVPGVPPSVSGYARNIPKYWDDMEAVWEQGAERWRTVGPGAAK